MKNKLKRVFALLLVVIMLGLVLLTLYLAITGSRYFMASLVSMFLLPILLYTYMFIYRLMHDDKE
ncbi:MAG: hypothetical protein IJ137_13055 [Eubacterium sp.]|nr:hypothetical protein [Eubacterium sp.]